LLPIGVSLILTAGALFETRNLLIGDTSMGVPELRDDSRYNQDVKMITSNFAIGVDLLQVIAEVKGDNSPCLSRDMQSKLEKFDFEMRQVEGVAAVRSLASFITAVTQDFAEGWVKWRMLPETTEQIAQAVGSPPVLETSIEIPSAMRCQFRCTPLTTRQAPLQQ